MHARMKDGRPAVFLDRDGTLIRDLRYLGKVEEIEFLEGAIVAIKELQKHGFILIVISNQSGIGRGLISRSNVDAVNACVVARLQKLGVRIQAVYYCPHAPWDQCVCRKPSPEMVFRAAREHRVNLSDSVFIGDKEIDVQTGRNSGIGRVILLNGLETRLHDGESCNWNEVVRCILAAPGKRT